MTIKKYKGQIFSGILIGMAMVGVYRYAFLPKSSSDLISNFHAAQKELQALKSEKEALSKELEIRKQDSQGIEQINAKLLEAEKALEELNVSVNMLKQENQGLKQDKDNLTLQVSSVTKERDALAARLKSFKELKKAIRDLKREIHLKKVAEWKEYVKKQKELDVQKLASGNQGYIVKSGKPTTTGKLSIEVVPAN